MTTSLGEPNLLAIVGFFIFIGISLGITYYAARHTRTAEQFYAAGRNVTGLQNGQEQLRVARGSTVLLGIFAIVLGIAFKGQNVAYMVGLAFAIAASANFPALLMSIFWRKFTTRGAQVSMLVGTASSLLLIYFSPTIQMDILKHASAAFPWRNPGLVSIPLSFLVGIVVSLAWPEPAAEAGFAKLEQRVHVGLDHIHAAEPRG